MPVKTVKLGKKHRVVEARTGHLARTKEGRPVDGGGHESEAKARAQARAINANTQGGGKGK